MIGMIITWKRKIRKPIIFAALRQEEARERAEYKRLKKKFEG